MRALLDDLGKTKSMYREMYQASVDSAGSASRENETYMRSLQARINSARVEVERLAVAFGNAFMTEGLIESLKVFSSLAELVTKATNSVGALPLVFTTVGTVALLASKNFRTFMTSLTTVGVESVKAKTELTTMNKSMLTTGMTANVAKNNLKALGTTAKATALSFGVIGVASVAFGYIIEKLLGHIQKTREAQEQLESENKQFTDSYKQNANEIDTLSAKYEKLQSVIDSGKYDSSTMKEYLDTQSKLAELLPQLKIGEDGYGNALVGNASIVKSRIELTKQQLAVQKELNAEKNKEKTKEKLDTASDNYKDANKKKKSTLSSTVSDTRLALSQIDPMKKVEVTLDPKELDTIDKVKKKIDELTQAKIKASKSGNEIDVQVYDLVIEKLRKGIDSYGEYENKAKSALLTIREENLKTLSSVLNTNDNISKSNKDTISKIFSTATLNANSEKSLKAYDDMVNSISSNKDMINAMNDFSNVSDKVSNATSNNFNKISKEAEKSFKSVKESILKASGLDDESNAYKELAKSIDIAVASELEGEKSARALANQKSITIEEARNHIKALGDETDATEEATNALDDYVSKLNELSSLEEQMVGMSQAKVDETNSLINTYQTLGAEVSIYKDQLKNKNLTEEESSAIQSALNSVTANRKDIEEKLYALYPDFIKKTGESIKLSADKIKIIKQEAEANDVLLKAYKLASEGKLSAEGIATMGHLQSTNARIKNINTEISALDKLAQAYKDNMEFYVTTLESYSKNDMFDSSEALRLQKSYMLAQQGLSRVKSMSKNKKAEYATLSASQKKYTSSLNSVINSIDSSTSSTNKNTSSKKKNNSETSKSIYLTDKYKQSMDKLNASIQKQENIMKKYPTWSKQYRKALQEQIKLKQKEIDKTNEQYALLKKQIKNGTILQTGTVTVKTKNTKSTTKTSSSASSSSLGYTGKYSATIKKYAKQYGVNPNLIAGIIKQESGFNKYATSSAGAKGLMQLMPATAKSLGVKNSYDPSQNIKGGTKLIAQLLKKYGGNVEKALRAYNAGPGNLAKSYGFKETNNYVKKVTSNYSSYLKKATGSVTKVSESAVKNMTTTVKKTTTRKLSGWNGKITSTQSSRINPVTGKREYHNGVDIAGKAGTRIDANIAGKVIASGSAKKNGYSSTYGNIVVIQDSKGNKHLYGHLQKALVKIGQKVDKGQAIAKMGSTGTATGSHLHYTVNQGKSNAMSYVKKARGNVKITSTGSASTKGVATSKKQAIDEAKATLLELDQLIDDKSAEILELRQAIIDSHLEEYDRNIQKREDKKSKRAISKERSVGDSDWYREAVNLDIADTKYQVKELKKKKKYIEKLRKQKGITPLEKANLGDELDKIKEQLNQYTSDLINSRSEYINSKLAQYDYKIELKDRNITKQDNLQGLMSNTSKQYAKSLENQKKSAKEKAKLLQSELNYAVTQSKYLKNGYQEMRKQKEKADEITNQIIENNQKLAEIANNEYLSKLAKNDSKTNDYDYLLSRSQTYADSLLDNDMNKYSEFGNQIDIKRDKIESIRKNNAILTKQMKDKAISDADKETAKAQLEANRLAVVELQADIRNMYKDTADYLIDLYKDIYEKRRDLEIKAIDEERKRYQKLINDKINELQKLNEEEDHKDQKADYQKQIAELEKRIRQYSGDDSRAGKYEKSKAEEELADLKKEYQKFMRDYETNNKIEEWQKDLDNKETELDDATDATNKYFDNIVNNERKFNEIRQKIISGNVDTFKNELAGMDDFITSNMGDIGEAIAQNISDQIKIATSKLGELGEHYGGDGSNDVWDTPGSAPQISDNYSGDSSPSATTGKITTIKKTNVYKSKKVDEKSVVTTIPKGTTLTYSEYASNWYKVTYNKKTGYVHRPDLQKTTTTTTKNNDGSTTKTKEVTQNGQFISKTATTTEGGLVKTVKEYNADGTVKSTKYGNVKTTADVTYRTKPDKNVKPSGTFKKGTEMQIQAVGDYYAKVLYSGKTYYLNKSKLKAFKTGGFTGDNVPESGALALLHKKELVLNEQQTKHILQTAETLKGLQLPKINMPNIQLPKTTPSEVDQSTTIEINIEKMTGTEQDLNKLADLIEQRQMKRMRKNGYTRKF